MSFAEDTIETSGNKLGSNPVDENDLDLQSLALTEGSELTFRAGRQELLYGLGRLVDVREGPNVQGRRFEPGLVRRLVRP